MTHQLTVRKTAAMPAELQLGVNGWACQIHVIYTSNVLSLSRRTKERNEEVELFLKAFVKDMSPMLRDSARVQPYEQDHRRVFGEGIRIVHDIHIAHRKRQTARNFQRAAFIALMQSMDTKWYRRPNGNVWYFGKSRHPVLREMDLALKDVEDNGEA